MTMSGVTIATAENVLVRIEAEDGTVGWGEAASAPTMTGDTLGGLVAAVRDHLAPLLVGQDALARADLKRIMARALVGNTGAHSAVEMALLDLAGRVLDRRADRSDRPAAAQRRAADVAPRQSDAGSGHRGSARQAGRRLPFLQAQDRREADRRRRSPPRSRSARRWAPRCRSAPTPMAGSRSRRASAMSSARARPSCSFVEQPLPPTISPASRRSRAAARADRHRRGHPRARRYRGACARRRRAASRSS